MSQPRADRVDIDTSAEEVDGRGMAHGMGTDALVAQRRHGLGGFVRDPYDEAVNAIASDRAAVDVEEDRCFTGAVDPWSEQSAKDLGGARPQWTSTDLASLAVESHGQGIGSQVRHRGPSGFGGTRTGVVETIWRAR